jgi:two-component system, cell cycle response regulator
VSQGGKVRILIMDDSRSVREEIRQVFLEARVDAVFFEAENGLDGFKILLEQPMDLVLCDLVMPHMDGLKFLQMRASRPDLLEVPVLMLTAVGDVDQKVKVLSQGAGDYVTKPFHPGELTARALVHLKIKQLQDELRQKNALLTELSTTDSLTKINNRRHFLELARKEMERSERLGLVLSLIMLDVDHFKEINDRHGHQVGDEVLVAICKKVNETLREYDVFGRYGGDEFTIMLPQTDLKHAHRVGERLEAGIQALAIQAFGDKPATISVGVAARSASSPDLESLLRLADQALYEAKKRGRACVVALEG